MLVQSLDRNAEEIEKGSLEVEVIALLELHRILMLYRKWQCDPAFPKLLETAIDAQHFRHDVVLLAAATVLVESLPLGVELIPTSTRRTPDLYIGIGLRRGFWAEVKAPVLSFATADRTIATPRDVVIVRKSFEQAKGQFASADAAVLIIGGPFWSDGDLDLLEGEARRMFSSLGVRRKHVAAALVVSTTAVGRRRSGTLHLPFGWDQVDFMAAMGARWIPNPAYKGPVKLEFPRDFNGPYHISLQPSASTAGPL